MGTWNLAMGVVKRRKLEKRSGRRFACCKQRIEYCKTCHWNSLWQCQSFLANLFNYFFVFSFIVVVSEGNDKEATTNISNREQKQKQQQKHKEIARKLVFQSRSFSIKWHHYMANKLCRMETNTMRKLTLTQASTHNYSYRYKCRHIDART